MAQGLVARTMQDLGIEDYTEEFRESIGAELPKEAFSRVIGQDRAVRHFVDSLNLDIRGRLNLGEAGVGKSLTVEELIRALTALDNGEEITGPYAQQVKGYFENRKNLPRGDIYALWNPDDYFTPIIFRANQSVDGVEVHEKLDGETYQWVESLDKDGIPVAEELRATEIAIDMLSDSYIKFIKNHPDLQDKEWTLGRDGRKMGVILNIDSIDARKYEEWAGTVNETFLRLSKLFDKRTADRAVRTALGEGPDSLLEAKVLKKKVSDTCFETIESVLDAHVEKLESLGSDWQEREPAIADWYSRVAAYFRDPKKRKPVLDSFIDIVDTITKTSAQDNEKTTKPDSKSRGLGYLRVRPAGTSMQLGPLLDCGLIKKSEGDKLIIRQPTIEDPIELFIDSERIPITDELVDMPVHKLISPGELAYADIVFIDDGMSDVLSTPSVRKALLTFLQNGQINIMNNNIQINFKSNAHLFACESNNPFRRQVFLGTEPEYDDGMERRFSVAKFESRIRHSAELVKSFPRILVQSTADARKTLNTDIRFSADAANLLYHYLLSEPSMTFPVVIGQQSRSLFKPLLARVAGRGLKEVTTEHVMEFLEESRQNLLEDILVMSHASQMPSDFEGQKIGSVNALYGGPGFGGAGRVTAIITNRFGKIISGDREADLMDETYHAGVLTADAWMGSSFGPLSLEVFLKMANFDKSGGASSSAANTYATLSVLGDIPIPQNAYVTGTILDREGSVGVIGRVSEKARGALKYHRQVHELANVESTPLVLYIPQRNMRELFRGISLSKELIDAIESEEMTVRPHSNIWDGFESITGVPREEYEPQIREKIEERAQRIADHNKRIGLFAHVE